MLSCLPPSGFKAQKSLLWLSFYHWASVDCLPHVTAHQETWTSIRRRMRGCLDMVSGTSMTDVTPLLDVLTRCHLLAALRTQTGYQHFCSTRNYYFCFYSGFVFINFHLLNFFVGWAAYQSVVYCSESCNISSHVFNWPVVISSGFWFSFSKY